jgi:hypothetical protein
MIKIRYNITNGKEGAELQEFFGNLETASIVQGMKLVTKIVAKLDFEVKIVNITLL